MQTHDTRPTGFQPTASAPKAKPLPPPSFEVVEPGRGSVNPFPPRPHEVWTAEPPSAPPVTVPPEVQAQVEPQNIGLFWTEFRMNAPGTPPTPPPNLGAGGRTPVVQRAPVTPEPYWYRGHPDQTQSTTPLVQRSASSDPETVQEPTNVGRDWIQNHFRMNAPGSPPSPPPYNSGMVTRVPREPVTPEPYWYQGPPVQAKLTVGAPNDAYEQEADRVAAQVMNMAPPTPPNLQRQAKEDELQTKTLAEPLTPIVQRQEEQEAPSAKILNSVMVGQVMCQSIPPLETDHPLTLPTPVTLTLTSPTQRFSLRSPSPQRFPRLSLFPTSQRSFPDLGLSPGRLNLPALDSPNLSPLSPLERESPLDQDLLSADTEPEDAQFSSDETGVELSRGGHVDSEGGASSVYAELTIQIPESRFPLLQQDDLQLNLDILNQMAARVELSGGTGGGLAISREMTLDLFRLTLQEGDNSYQTFEAIVQFISQTDGSTVGGTIRYRPWQELAIEAGGQVDIGEVAGGFSGGIGVTPVNGLEITMRGNFTASDSEVQIDSVSLQITISPSLGESSSTSSGQRLQESDAEDLDLATETEATTAPPIQRAATNLPQVQPDLESRLSASQSGGNPLKCTPLSRRKKLKYKIVSCKV